MSWPAGQLAHWSTGQLVCGGGFAALGQLLVQRSNGTACPVFGLALTILRLRRLLVAPGSMGAGVRKPMHAFP